VEYSQDGSALRGTGGAIRNALPKLGENFFVMYGDSYLTCDYAGVEGEFLRRGKLGLMTLFHNHGQWDASNVEFEDGRILVYSKKKKTQRMRFIDYGLGAFRREAFTRTHAGDLADVYAELLQAGELAGTEVHERFYEIGSSAGLEETTRLLSGQEAARE
jgi:NDP-sugar pyrophosphorylase family protein